MDKIRTTSSNNKNQLQNNQKNDYNQKTPKDKAHSVTQPQTLLK